MIDMLHANGEAAFEFARQLATAEAPSDIVELWTLHARRQFEMLSEQTKELTALGQKIAAKAPSRSLAALTKPLDRHSRNWAFIRPVCGRLGTQ
jgi:hypothetical protein